MPYRPPSPTGTGSPERAADERPPPDAPGLTLTGTGRRIVAPVRTYTVRAEWGEGHWVLTVPEVPGLSRQVRWLAEAAGTISGAIASEVGTEPQSVGVEIVPVMREELAALVDQVARARDELARVQRQVSAFYERGSTDAAGIAGATVKATKGQTVTWTANRHTTGDGSHEVFARLGAVHSGGLPSGPAAILAVRR